MSVRQRLPYGYQGIEREAAEQALANLALAVAKGIRVKAGWTRKAPKPLIEIVHGTTWTFGAVGFHLIDHPYRLLYPDGTTVFVAEPYGYDEDELRDCAERIGSEWEIVLGKPSLYYPGRTTPIWYRQRKGRVTAMSDLRLGPFQDVLADVRDVDLVLTDPPYPYEFIEAWSELGAWAAKALKPGALLVAYSGQYWLGARPEAKTRPAERGVLQRLGEHLECITMTWLNTPGANVSLRQVPVMSAGKPILFYARPGTYDGPLREEPPAPVTSPRRTREMHKWEQHLLPARELVERYSEPGDLVAEPFLGSGTFALAAKQLGRRVVGAEVDPVAYETAVQRLT